MLTPSIPQCSVVPTFPLSPAQGMAGKPWQSAGTNGKWCHVPLQEAGTLSRMLWPCFKIKAGALTALMQSDAAWCIA